jgi:N-acetylglucosaminyldiphosphoundecaprenol N-acetyl-beta-D-mannosaminyltransferase
VRNRAAAVPIGAVSVMAMTESDVVEHVADAWRCGDGGSIVTVNVDILRAASRDSDVAALVTAAEIVVSDGKPIVWMASVAGHPVPERVTGASLVWTLAEAAAAAGRSVYLIGGDPGVPEAAGLALAVQFPGLRIAGTDSPPYGFEKDEQQIADLVMRVAATQPDLVLVGLGFPKQERLISRLREVLPKAWMLGCGAGIPYAAGQFHRAPAYLQRIGAEWVHRLVLEPRRLARRYLLHDLPFAVLMLARAVGDRLIGQPAPPAALRLAPTAPTAPTVLSVPMAPTVLPASWGVVAPLPPRAVGAELASAAPEV